MTQQTWLSDIFGQKMQFEMQAEKVKIDNYDQF